MIYCGPINNLSFGQVFVRFLYQRFEENKEEEICIFPISPQIDFSAYSYGEEFNNWVVEGIKRAQLNYANKDSCLKLWHINGSHDRISKNNHILFTFHETSDITDTEKNILSNQDELWVTSNYTKSVFESKGLNCKKIEYPLDSFHFKSVKQSKIPGVITFNITGKLEKRKATVKIIKAWISKYGKNKRFRLNASVTNPFLIKINDPNATPEQAQAMFLKGTRQLIEQDIGEELPFNINLLPFFPRNGDFNKVLNNCDIHLAMSRCEGLDLTTLHAKHLGKTIIGLNAHVYKDYLPDYDKAFLIEPKPEMIDAVDGVFFVKDQPFNQGQWFDWDENEFIDKCDFVVKNL